MSVIITMTPEMIEQYNDAQEKGYKGSLADFVDEAVKAFAEMKRR